MHASSPGISVPENFRHIVRTVVPQSSKIAIFGYFYSLFDKKIKVLSLLKHFNQLAMCGGTFAIQRRKVSENFRQIVRTVFTQSPKIAIYGHFFTHILTKIKVLTLLKYFNQLAICGGTFAIQRRNIHEKFRQIVRTVFPQSPEIAIFGHFYRLFDKQFKVLTLLKYFNLLAICGGTFAIQHRNVPENFRQFFRTVFT